MIGHSSGQDGVILHAQDCPFCSCNKILSKSKWVHEIFLSQNILRDSKKTFCDLCVGMELENKKTVSVNKNENKGNKNVDEFQEYFLQQKQANTKVETQSDMSLVCHIINLPLIKLVRSSWLYIGLSLFMFLWTSNSTQAIKMQRRTWLISSHLDLVLGQYTFIVKRFLWGLDFLLGQGKI